jgi:hypothetical protein
MELKVTNGGPDIFRGRVGVEDGGAQEPHPVRRRVQLSGADARLQENASISTIVSRWGRRRGQENIPDGR